jgi:hypothetical protein
VERPAVLGKSRHGVVQALTAIEEPVPVPLRGVDSDNGSEFLNTHRLAGGQARPAGRPGPCTRSRPSPQDDHAPGEPTNGTPVRPLVGWEREDTPEALAALTALDTDVRRFPPLLQPSMQLVRRGGGSRLIRRADQPQTPVARVKACAEADPAKVAARQRGLETTDPVARSQRLDRALKRLWALATQATRTPRETTPRAAPPRASTPWQGGDVQPHGPTPEAGDGRVPTP